MTLKREPKSEAPIGKRFKGLPAGCFSIDLCDEVAPAIVAPTCVDTQIDYPASVEDTQLDSPSPSTPDTFDATLDMLVQLGNKDSPDSV